MENRHPHPRNSAHETAALHLVKRVATASPDETVASVLARLQGSVFDYADRIYVVDEISMLTGMIPMPRLLAAAPHQHLRDILRKPFPVVQAEVDQETVASLAIVKRISAVPVVDSQQRLLGVVPPQALLEILRHEHVEDLHRLVGIRHYTLQARSAIEAPPIRRARDRLPWLLVGLLGGMLATYVMTRFESSLQSQVAIAFFVPALVYLADAIGTQTEAITVRGLSLSNATVGTMIAGELRTGLIIGLTLGALTFPVIWLIFGDIRLALAVSVALLTAGSVATTIGFLFPWTFPAWAGAPPWAAARLPPSSRTS